ncbi:CML13 [Symbiodinium natans]|uniref:Calmodulin n=1 Tax=Symbiodinium natans TaxID=878477 RepID=A0A812NYK8_9DINO|nr:CML13 [Symbiodinium natans]
MALGRRRTPAILTIVALFFGVRQVIHFDGGNVLVAWPTAGPQVTVASHHHHQRHRETHEESIFEELVEEVTLCPWLLFAEVCLVVILNAVFESVQHWVRHSLDHAQDKVGLQIMDVLFKEFSGLGFIGMFLFLVTQSKVSEDVLGRQVFGDSLKDFDAEDPVAESFETVHMMIFLLMAVLLFQAMALLRVTKSVIETWGRYERARAWGTRPDSIESLFCESGFLERVAMPYAPRGLELHCKKPFTYENPLGWWMVLNHDTLRNLVMWRAIRHQFIFGANSKAKSGSISCPRQFSFESYLRERLGRIVVHVVEVDMYIWLSTLLTLTPMLYGCIHLNFYAVNELLVFVSYLLLAIGMVVAYLLESDTLALTPTLPEDARQILVLFSGTSSYMLMKHYDMTSTICAELKFGAPGLCDVDIDNVELGKAPASSFQRASMKTEHYAFIFELLAFWQAILVTCLVLFYLSVPLTSWSEIVLYSMAWAEWPLMLFGVMPVLLERLTIRSSIGDETDNQLVRTVSLETKSMLLRYHIRLAQLMGYEKRLKKQQLVERHRVNPHQVHNASRLIHAATAATLGDDDDDKDVVMQAQLLPHGASAPAVESMQVPPSSPRPGDTSPPKQGAAMHRAVRKVNLITRWNSKTRIRENWTKGLRLFRALPYGEQHEIEQIFSSLDINNNEEVMLGDLADHWRAMGFRNTEESAQTLLESIDYDGNKQLTWNKFQAAAALAISASGERDWHNDYKMLFNLIDRNRNGRLTVFDIASWLEDMKSGMTEMDVASLLYQHFGQAKPYVDQNEFVDWIGAIGLPHANSSLNHYSH